jgi:hypothetical protein
MSAGVFIWYTRASFPEHGRVFRDVCFWHKADIPAAVNDVRFRGQSGHRLKELPSSRFLSGIGEINEKRSYLYRFFSPGNGPVLGGPGRGLDSLARRELHGECAAMDLLRRRHRRDRACSDPAGAPIIASPFHPIFCFSAVRPVVAQSGHAHRAQGCLLLGEKQTLLRRIETALSWPP